MTVTKFNHIGHCVTNVERSRKFYEQALGFKYDRELTVEGEGTSKLLRVKLPLKLHAVYLVREGFTLELLYYSQPGTAPQRERAMNEPGLTHISLNVRDMPATLKKIKDLGGQVLDDTNLVAAVFVKDPDGQLIELIQQR
ncbi:MAG: VOC family protein [Chloroflexi bacterium]|nr:VOC family protein [Chloroflexota bacterium]